MVVRAICISESTPSCIRAPPDDGMTIKGASCRTASRAAANRLSPTAVPIEPPEEAEVERRNDRRGAPDAAVGDHDRIVMAGAVTRLAEPVHIALAIAKPKGVLGHLRQLYGLIVFVVEEQREALVGAEPHVMIAARTDPEIALKLAVKNHLLALVALLPQVVRDVGLAKQAAYLGT